MLLSILPCPLILIAFLLYFVSRFLFMSPYSDFSLAFCFLFLSVGKDQLIGATQ